MNSVKLIKLLAVFAFFGCVQLNTYAQSASVAVNGDVDKPYLLNASEISSMKRLTVSAMTGHDGVMYTYSGVSLFDILAKAQSNSGNQLKGTLLRKYLLVTGADNYRVIITIPEFDPAFTDRMIILADQEDGEKLPAATGPYRLVIPGDKKPARSVRQVTGITVQTVK